MKIPVIFVLLVFGLTACRVELPPIESAFVAKTWITADSPNKTALSRAQIDALEVWFTARPEGWKYEIADINPDTFLLFRPSHGKDTWVYLTGNRIWVRNYMRRLAVAERGELDSILGSAALPAFR